MVIVVYYKQTQQLYVGNLSPETSEDKLKYLFNKVSENAVIGVRRVKDFAFVEFRTSNEAHTAKAAMDGVVVDNYEIQVSWAKGHNKIQRKGSKVWIQFDTKTSGKLVDNNGSIPLRPKTGFVPNQQRYQGIKESRYQRRGQWNFQMFETFKNQNSINGSFQEYQHQQQYEYNQACSYYYHAHAQQFHWRQNGTNDATPLDNPYHNEYSPFFDYGTNDGRCNPGDW